MMFRADSRLGPYTILAPLPLAGAGEVYRARDDAEAREVAIRVLLYDFASDPATRHRFQRDMRAALAFVHPNALRIVNVGIDHSAAYIVSESITGETLRSAIDRGAVGPDAAIRVAAQVDSATAAARAAGVEHIELTPEEIVIDRDGRVTLLGLGLASLTGTGSSRMSDLAAVAAIAGVPRAAPPPPPPRRVAAMAALAMLALALVVAVPRLDSARGPGTNAERRTERAMTGDAPAGSASVAAVGRSLSAVDSTRGVPGTVEESGPAGAPDKARPTDLALTAPRSQAALPSLPSPPPAASAPVPVAPTPAARPESQDRDAATLVTEARVRATEFDLAAASTLLRAAAARGEPDAPAAALYAQGLIDAREAARRGGTAESLAPVRAAIASLEAISKGRPGSAEIARLMLHAAAAAAQSEREEMRLYIESATRMEAIQHAAGMPGAPLVTASETAGDLWLLVDRYDEARQAYDEAAERLGSTLRILAGRARAARGANDVAGACAAYRSLLEAWAGRPGLPVEIAEAREYSAGFCAGEPR